jgi:hypothetical protein
MTSSHELAAMIFGISRQRHPRYLTNQTPLQGLAAGRRDLLNPSFCCRTAERMATEALVTGPGRDMICELRCQIRVI